MYSTLLQSTLVNITNW